MKSGERKVESGILDKKPICKIVYSISEIFQDTFHYLNSIDIQASINVHTHTHTHTHAPQLFKLKNKYFAQSKSL